LDIIGILITTGVSAACSALIGLSIRVTIERKLNQARSEAEDKKKRRIRWTLLRDQWQQFAGRILHLLVKKALGEVVNGELTEANIALYEVERQKKDIEQQYTAEAQED
jgi:hypothetical protein